MAPCPHQFGFCLTWGFYADAGDETPVPIVEAEERQVP